jgi:signal recognition particle subunit SRP54
LRQALANLLRRLHRRADPGDRRRSVGLPAMFDTLTGQFDKVFRRLKSRGKLHPKQVDNALADIRTALLEADVAVDVADDFLARVRARALSEEVTKSITPGQQVVKVVRDELQTTLGGEFAPFVLPGGQTTVIMMAGVQGSGKTTACAKLALLLKEKGKHPLLAACDLARPAAIEQLFTLGREVGVPVTSEGNRPEKVAKNAVKQANREGKDVVIIDTAGRLHTKSNLMDELAKIRRTITKRLPEAQPEVLFVLDATTGQNGLLQAKAFNETSGLTAIALTKLDSTSKGGVAFAIERQTGVPVLFVGLGEKLDDLRDFDPNAFVAALFAVE